MKYISTRGGAAPVDFVGACLAGLAPDGGLYVPESYPQIAPAKPNERYADLATRILSAFAGDALNEETVDRLCEAAYSSFSHHGVTPLVQTARNTWMLELFHGPTLAFKDVAMQFIAQLYEHVLSKRGDKMSVVCATSGDTGGAAAAAFAGAEHVNLFILHPHERVSPVQRLFMTTTGAGNVSNLALEGDFDDCQAIVKGLFADHGFAGDVSLSGVNSINWARIAAQAVYYAAAQAALGPGRPLTFVVPSGNMGDALAGYVAHRCGLLTDPQFVCAVNENDSLAELLSKGVMKRAPAVRTPSPAMDISVPSNFERLLFEATGRDSDQVRAVYANYAQSGEAVLPGDARERLKTMGLTADAVANPDTLAEMARFEGETGMVICPHTAVGTAVTRTLDRTDRPRVVLATAHPAKFPETVQEALGNLPVMPKRGEDLKARDEHFEVMPADPSAVREHMLVTLKGRGIL